MSRRVQVGALLGAAAVMVATTGAQPASAIVNGATVSPAPSWMAFVQRGSGLAKNDCSGTLVAPGWVLTAGHCVTSEPPKASSTKPVAVRPVDPSATQEFVSPQVNSPATYRIALATANVRGTRPALTVSSIAVDPQFRYVRQYQQDSSGNPVHVKCNVFDFRKQCRNLIAWGVSYDAALLHLTNDSTNTPITLAGKTDGPSDAYGYGFASQTPPWYQISPDGLLRHFTNPSDLTSCPEPFASRAMLCGATPVSQIAQGDSGGPWTQQQHGTLAQVGISSIGVTDASSHNPVDIKQILPWVDATAGIRPATSSTVLVVGSGDYGTTAPVAWLSDLLTAAGYTVTTQLTDALPADLDPYEQVWDITTNPLAPNDQDALVAYAQAGHGVYLTGEHECCEALNDSDSVIINNLVSGGIQVGHLGDQGNDATVNPTAVGDASQQPFVLTGLPMGQPGGLQNVAPANVFASAGLTVGAVWGSDDVLPGGRLAILMDINWLEKYKRTAATPQVVQDLALFLGGLSTPPGAPVATYP